MDNNEKQLTQHCLLEAPLFIEINSDSAPTITTIFSHHSTGLQSNEPPFLLFLVWHSFEAFQRSK